MKVDYLITNGNKKIFPTTVKNVKSSLAKVNFLLKTNTLDVSTTEKVTKNKLNFNQN